MTKLDILAVDVHVSIYIIMGKNYTAALHFRIFRNGRRRRKNVERMLN